MRNRYADVNNNVHGLRDMHIPIEPRKQLEHALFRLNLSILNPKYKYTVLATLTILWTLKMRFSTKILNLRSKDQMSQ